MPDLQQKWHGAPLWAWYGGGTVVVVGGYILWKRRQAAKAAGSQANSTTSGMDTSLPQVNPLGSDTGWFGGSSPTGSIIGYDGSGNPVYSGFPGSSSPAQVAVAPPAATPMMTPFVPSPSSAPPATTVAAGNPADQYAIGQTVNPSTGEKIVAQVFSPVYGWINETNLGGIYTGGGGQPGQSIGGLANKGSYLGYVAQRFGVGTPQAQAEIAQHGTFGPGGLKVLPGGGYSETNAKGETYSFGH